MNRVLLIILSVILLGSNKSALADRIIAIVEDTPITMSQLEQRKKLLGFFNQAKNLSGEEDREYTNMVFQSMIDDQVLSSYAKDIGLIVTPKEIDSFINNIEQNGKMKPGFLAHQVVNTLHLPLDELRNKMRAEIIRSKIVRESLSRNVNISQEDVESMVLATNFRDAKLKLKIFTAKYSGKKVSKFMAGLPSKIKSCKRAKYVNYKSFADLSEMEVKLSELSPSMQALVKDLDIDQASDVIEDDQLRVVLVCERTLEQFTPDDSNSISNFLGNKKLQIKAQKFFQDLRKKAYVKILM